MALINCPECGREVSDVAKMCPACGAPIDTAVRCPKCNSKNVKIISGASKVASIAMWGVFAANKVRSRYVCNDCKSEICRFKFS